MKNQCQIILELKEYMSEVTVSTARQVLFFEILCLDDYYFMWCIVLYINALQHYSLLLFALEPTRNDITSLIIVMFGIICKANNLDAPCRAA